MYFHSIIFLARQAFEIFNSCEQTKSEVHRGAFQIPPPTTKYQRTGREEHLRNNQPQSGPQGPRQGPPPPPQHVS